MADAPTNCIEFDLEAFPRVFMDREGVITLAATFNAITTGLLLSVSLFLGACSTPSGPKAAPPKSDYIFNWSKPVASTSLPITQSATCSFKRSVGTDFRSDDGDKANTLPIGISYSVADENEADTVSFVDLDTTKPKSQSNGGQASLEVNYDDGDMLTLSHSALLPVGGTVETYTIFRKKRIVIHNQQQNSAIVGPSGVLEMGFCN